jgi:hypothetical protein
MKHFVVYCYKDGDEIIYIGYTQDPVARQNQHSWRSPWWKPTLTWEVMSEWCFHGIRSSREYTLLRLARHEVMTEEQRLIEQYDPPGNMRHTSRNPPSGPRTKSEDETRAGLRRRIFHGNRRAS